MGTPFYGPGSKICSTMASVYRRAATRWLSIIGAVILVPSRAPAQWLNVPQASSPRTADGRPDIMAQAGFFRIGFALYINVT